MSDSFILASLCYVKKNGKTLMLHRVSRQGDMHFGRWNGLGGKMIPGETPEECAIREVEEESGLRIRSPRLAGVLTFPDFNGNGSWYAFVFTADEFDGELRTHCEEGSLEWVDDEKLYGLRLWEGDPVFMEWIRQGRFFSGKFIYRDGLLRSYEAVLYSSGSTESVSREVRT